MRLVLAVRSRSSSRHGREELRRRWHNCGRSPFRHRALQPREARRRPVQRKKHEPHHPRSARTASSRSPPAARRCKARRGDQGKACRAPEREAAGDSGCLVGYEGRGRRESPRARACAQKATLSSETENSRRAPATATWTPRMSRASKGSGGVSGASRSLSSETALMRNSRVARDVFELREEGVVDVPEDRGRGRLCRAAPRGRPRRCPLRRPRPPPRRTQRAASKTPPPECAAEPGPQAVPSEGASDGREVLQRVDAEAAQALGR